MSLLRSEFFQRFISRSRLRSLMQSTELVKIIFWGLLCNASKSGSYWFLQMSQVKHGEVSYVSENTQ